MDAPYLVQAIYNFKGKNNDELCFKKGDVISVSQREEGGWWEGTLNGQTGWFPSNYVSEYKTEAGAVLSPKGASPVAVSRIPAEMLAQQRLYRALVVQDLCESERAHVAEMQTLQDNYLSPLEQADILTPGEFRQLTGNISQVLATHQLLLAGLDECIGRPGHEQRVGRLFLSIAPRAKQVHVAYCSSHPRAVAVLDKHKETLGSWMESHGAASPGLLVLTTGLSKPFRRLDKYAAMLQECERHCEENHPDRGDTQRAVAVYKELASSCAATRRQKELELEVLVGGVRGWEGEPLSSLGEIMHMGSVAVGPDHRDRYLVLFPTTLLVLGVSPRMSAWLYEGKLPLTGITVIKLEDSENYKNAFEIAGPLIERIVAVCQTKDDQSSWVEILQKQIRGVRSQSASSTPTHIGPSPPPPARAVSLPGTPPPPPPPPPPAPLRPSSPRRGAPSTSSSSITVRGWTMSCLRPAPPLRPCLAPGGRISCATSTTGIRNSDATSARSFEEDAQILRVIEAYCRSASHSRFTVASGAANEHPQLLIAEEEKLLVDESVTSTKNDSSCVRASLPEDGIQQKSLVDTVYALRDQLRDLTLSVTSLTQQLESEAKLRRALQTIVRTHLNLSGTAREDIRWPEE